MIPHNNHQLLTLKIGDPLPAMPSLNPINFTKSGSHDSLLCILNTCLTYIFLVWPGSLASNMHVTSGVSG